MARIAYIRGAKNGKADYWLSDEKVKAAIASAWDWTSENVPYAASLAWDKTKSGASSAWDWTTDHTYCKVFNCEKSSAEGPSAEGPSAEGPSAE